MGTKNNPGEFDCYENADPDEPMFVLLGRDKHAPEVVRYWADLHASDGEEPAKLAEARACANAMEKWGAEKTKIRTLQIMWADAAIERALKELVALRDGWEAGAAFTTRLPLQTIQVAIDAIRAAKGE